MKRIAIVCSLLCLPLFSALAGTLASVAKVEEATVFYKGATLRCTATAVLEKGSGTLEISGLSPSIDRNSLKIKAGGGVLISAIEFSSGRFQDPEGLKRVAAMRDSLSLLQKQLQESSNRLSIQEKMLDLLTGSIEHNLSGRSSGATSTEISSNLEMYRKNAENYYKSIDAENERNEELSAQESALTERIAEAEKLADKACGVLKLSYNAPASGKVVFSISYYTTAARWTPFYEINVPELNGPVSLTAKGQVRQSTGLDWKQLKLHLSSGSPDKTRVSPTMSTWRLGFKTYPVRSNQVVMAKAAMREELVAESAAESATMDNYVEIVEAGLETSYDIALPYDIAGDGSIAAIELKHYEMPASYEHFTAPRLSTEVFLTAKIEDWDAYQLLPGSATVSFAGAYVGKTTLDKAGKDGSIRLTLGVDPSIQVTRERTENVNTPAILGSSTTVSCGWRNTIRNAGNKSIRLKVQDQIPISSEKEIEIKNIRYVPEGGYLNNVTGIITWEFPLAAGKTQQTEVSYKVKYPSEKALDSSL